MNLWNDSVNELRAAFDAVEGEGFYDRSYNSESRNDIGYIINMFLDRGTKDEYQTFATLYGGGGFHRYHVRGNGYIRFDEYYIRSKTNIENVRKAGFAIKGRGE